MVKIILNNSKNMEMMAMDVNSRGYTCPLCNNICSGKIVDTRRTDYGKRRRRQCEKCGKRFTTIEFAIEKRKDIYEFLFTATKSYWRSQK